MRILILCTGNSCRSQMAEAYLKTFDDNLDVYSAGTFPTEKVNPYAIKAMEEVGVNIKDNKPKNVDEFLTQQFDYVITVCDEANEACPFFTGKVTHRLHISFEDPALAKGTEEEIMNEFRKVRDQIKTRFAEFYFTNIK